MSRNEFYQSLIEGIEMTKGMLEKSFKSAGIKEENPVGEKFDPNLHNALFQMESTDLEPGVVGQVGNVFVEKR